MDLSSFLAGRRDRTVRILARMLSLAENDPETAYRILGSAQTSLPEAQAHVVGITGPPGVGKSSLVNALIMDLRSRNQTVAVLAIDPSSQFTGGALLGDRVRMNRHATDPGVYIRSVATRGALGGMARAAWLGVQILETWGFDWIIIETAGVGQSEIDIVNLADTTTLVLSPATGDDVQVMKAGVMEIADLFVINKADLPGAGRLESAITSLLTHSASSVEPPRVILTTATTSPPENGVSDLTAWLNSRKETQNSNDQWATRRRRRHRDEIRRTAMALLAEKVDAIMGEESAAASGTLTDPLAAATGIVQRVLNDTPRSRPDE